MNNSVKLLLSERARHLIQRISSPLRNWDWPVAPYWLATALSALSFLMALSLLPAPLTAAHWFATAGVVLALIALASVPSIDEHSAAPKSGGSIFGERLENRLEQLQDVHWAITENETRLRDLLDSQDDMILRRDSFGRITFANKAFCEAFGVDPQKVVTSKFAPVVLDRDDSRSETVSEARSRAVELVETLFGPRWIAWEHLPRPHAGTLAETQITGRDVTAERDADVTLRDARDQAETANRAKSRFLAAVSHEIRTPMNGILGMAGLLTDTPMAPDQATYVRAIDQSAKNLLALIDEILDFSKIEAGKLVLNDEPFSLETTVQAAVELLAPGAEEKGLDLAWIIGPDCRAQFKGDAARVRQIVLNLISNAIKFTDQGGVLVTVARKPSETDNGRASLRITITDTGIGLSQPEQTAIFSEFEQTDAAIKRQRGGTGLGLTISMQLARAMGGDVTVVSAPGKGSAFTVSLDLEEVAGSDQPAEAAASTEVVLVASDRIIERQALILTVRNAGFKAVETSSADALGAIEEAAKAGRPLTRIIVDGDCDTELAGVMLERAKDLAGAVSVKGLVLVGTLGRKSLDAFRANGYDAYIVRPVRPQSLIDQLSDVPLERSSDANAAGQPANPGAAAADSHAKSKIKAALRNQRILLVEDNAVNELLARRLLEKAGCEVITATDGIEAVDMVDEVRTSGKPPFSLILMDVQMPRLNGVEAARTIKANYDADPAKKPCPPIVAITANAFAEDRQRYLDAGMDDYLAKPFDAQGLKALLERWAGAVPVRRRKSHTRGAA